LSHVRSNLPAKSSPRVGSAPMARCVSPREAKSAMCFPWEISGPEEMADAQKPKLPGRMPAKLPGRMPAKLPASSPASTRDSPALLRRSCTLRLVASAHVLGFSHRAWANPRVAAGQNSSLTASRLARREMAFSLPGSQRRTKRPQKEKMALLTDGYTRRVSWHDAPKSLLRPHSHAPR
jgi:hypothetical protein